MKLFRKIEKEVLDEHFKTYEILKYPLDFVIYSVFRAFGEYEQDSNENKGHVYESLSKFNQILNAVQNCIVWRMKYNTTDKPKSDSNLNIVYDYINWGYTYSILTDLHISKSRNQVDVIIDKKNKIIRFTSLPKIYYLYSIKQSEIFGKIVQTINQNIPKEKLFDEFRKYENSSLLVSYKTTLHYEKIFDGLILGSVDRNFDLGGFSVYEFIHFHTTVYIMFMYFLYQKDKTSLSCKYQKGIFINSIQRISRLSKNTIQIILNELTLKLDRKVLISNTPFILHNDFYYFSPSIYTNLEPNRMIIGALNKRKDNRIYDSLIDGIEKFWTEKIYQELKDSTKYKILFKKKFKDNYKEITPDFIVYDKDFLLIIDYKHFIQPISVSETYNKNSGLNDGVSQLRKYETFFKKNQSTITEIDSIPKDNFKKILLFRKPMTILNMDSDVIYCSVFELEKLIEEKCSLKEFLHSLEYQKINEDNIRFKIDSIKVQDWTYQYTTPIIDMILEK